MKKNILTSASIAFFVFTVTLSFASDEPKTVSRQSVIEIKEDGGVKKFISHFIARDGFISKEEIEASGVVVKSKNGNIYMHKGDEMFLSFKDPSSVKEGDRYTVFEKREKVLRPQSGEYLGDIIETLGYVEITRVGEAVEGKITSVYREIAQGARLTRYEEPLKEISYRASETDVTAIIMAGIEGKKEIAENDVVYIDKGSADGLKEGNVLAVYRERPEQEDPLKQGEKLKLPPINLGELLIIKTKDASATGIVLKSLENILIGDRARTDKIAQ